MESINCDFCHCNNLSAVTSTTDLIHQTTKETFKIVRCDSCGLQFTNPRPNSSEIGQYYSSGYAFHTHQLLLKTVILDVLSWLANSKLFWFVSLVPFFGARLIPYVKPCISDPVKMHYTKGNILDIGCGSGESAHFWGRSGSVLAYKKFSDVYGVEIDTGARERLKVNGIEGFESLSDVPDDLKFNIIRMNWSLEHVHSPSEYFDFMSKHIDSSGTVIVSVPNYDGLIYKVSKDCVEIPIHLFHFRKKDLENYAEKFGFKIVDFYTFSYPQMFAFASTIFSGFKSFAGFPKSLIEARLFQKTLNLFDASYLGNDMIIVLKKL